MRRVLFLILSCKFCIVCPPVHEVEAGLAHHRFPVESRQAGFVPIQYFLKEDGKVQGDAGVVVKRLDMIRFVVVVVAASSTKTLHYRCFSWAGADISRAANCSWCVLLRLPDSMRTLRVR